MQSHSKDTLHLTMAFLDFWVDWIRWLIKNRKNKSVFLDFPPMGYAQENFI